MKKPSPFSSLILLYEKMDAAWNETAEKYGFTCNGCSDNCCETLFFHHTHLEKAYLRQGFKRLPLSRRKEMKKKARHVIQTMAGAEEKKEALRIMCPANEKGRCTLYGFRPMICRLHGIPHELKRPGGQVTKGPGCLAGESRFSGRYHPFDRTPFYREMSLLEMQYCNAHGKTARIKQTIAQMLI
ncbi:Putative zinc-or iron-chelating domain-containing protein [Desulfocicer vacuolatum DSM 3385]|uniref:Putative zinc-or iron-chelating domain-containing protein n=1 Tax=Desulfocicer vacuolatum DSM 3385 TaxID=1121400 RepID=A0A1W1ZVE8_9BACT|nr:YkgJ family cysteine cluster protein [Desulfocicer vacuolatum]SMC52384.1 Putative zinc-or iron-chelating domain-containing protein [Desulfocicer vacuolatum DSM 3385]